MSTYKIKRVSKILESMTEVEPVVAPPKPAVKPFNPSRPAKPLVDPGPKNYNQELKKAIDRYNKLIAAGMKPEVETITGK